MPYNRFNPVMGTVVHGRTGQIGIGQPGIMHILFFRVPVGIILTHVRFVPVYPPPGEYVQSPGSYQVLTQSFHLFDWYP